MWRRGEPLCTAGDIANWCTHYENNMEFPQKIKNKTGLWPRNSMPGYIFKETQNTSLKRYMHPYGHCSIIYNSQNVEATQVPINTWQDNVTFNSQQPWQHRESGKSVHFSAQSKCWDCNVLDGASCLETGWLCNIGIESWRNGLWTSKWHWLFQWVE